MFKFLPKNTWQSAIKSHPEETDNLAIKLSFDPGFEQQTPLVVSLMHTINSHQFMNKLEFQKVEVYLYFFLPGYLIFVFNIHFIFF